MMAQGFNDTMPGGVADVRLCFGCDSCLNNIQENTCGINFLMPLMLILKGWLGKKCPYHNKTISE